MICVRYTINMYYIHIHNIWYLGMIYVENKKIGYKKKMGATAMFWNDEKTLAERMEIEKDIFKKLGIAFCFYAISMGAMYWFL